MKYVDEKSNIPLFGLDFMGILGRGTNLLEVKPITICNLYCKYCFVRAGDYIENFTIDPDYIVKWLKYALEIKGADEYEIHIAPYGEFFLYKSAVELIEKISRINHVETISIQTNGTLLNLEIIEKLEKAGLTRLNISFNSLDQDIARQLSGSRAYSVQRMLQTFENVLRSNIDLLIAPIWFFGINDEEIIKIIKLVNRYRQSGYNDQKIRLGIQNYLVYRTGRKINKIHQRQFSYFYQKLGELENNFGIKLKLGPHDFNIHPNTPISPPVKRGQKVNVQIQSRGRTKNEYIGALNEMWAVKILSRFPLKVGAFLDVEVIKKKTSENLITAVFKP